MKIKHLTLLLAILAGAAAVGVSGYRLKTELIEPLGLEQYQDKSIFELPFLARTDEELMFYIEFADEYLNPEPTEPATQPPVTTQPTISSTTQPSTGPAPTETAQPTAPPTTTTPTQSTVPPTTVTPTQSTVPPLTDSSQKPTFNFPEGRVDDSWFENTLFIGDSRMQGLSLYARSGNAHYFAVQAMTFTTAFKKTLSDQDNFKDKTLEQLLTENHYDKIIINFGLNEAGSGSYDYFSKRFDQFIQKVRQLQPEAKIILNGIMPVTKNYILKSKYGGDYWEPEYLHKLSEVFRSYANGTDMFYIDCTEYFADSNGYLYGSVTGDGCHPKPKYYKTWREWMNSAIYQLGI